MGKSKLEKTRMAGLGNQLNETWNDDDYHFQTKNQHNDEDEASRSHSKKIDSSDPRRKLQKDKMEDLIENLERSPNRKTSNPNEDNIFDVDNYLASQLLKDDSNASDHKAET